MQFIKGDVRNREDVRRAMKGCNMVVHFAAETHVDRSILQPEAFITTDVYGTYVVLDTARELGIERFLHISTDEVYGEATKPCKEDFPLFPRSPYSASKAGADRLAYSYFHTYGLPVIIARPTNAFGPYQFPEKVIPLFITNAIDDLPLPVYGDGRNIREWLYVKDLCPALEMLLVRGEPGEVYNVGSGEEYMVIEIANLILEFLGKPKDLIKFVTDRPAHIRRHCVDSSKIKELGWEKCFSFKEALKHTIDWYKENEKWWRSIKERNEEYIKFMERWYAR